MSTARDTLEWRFLRIALGAVALIMVSVLAGWKVHDLREPTPLTRLQLSVRCLHEEKGIASVVVPAGDPLADSAGDGSFKTKVEGNPVTVALASSEAEAVKLERYYRNLSGGLARRLERRYKTVYLWMFTSSPSQRQTMYDCQY